MDWAKKHAVIGWRGHVPLPFNLYDAEGSDTDMETANKVLQDSAAQANFATDQVPKRRDPRQKEHYYKVSLKLRAILPIEWFPRIARILVEQMQSTAGEDGKQDETMESHVATIESEKWTPGAQNTVREKIREEVVMKEVIELAAWLNLQSEYFSLTEMTNESIKSLRESLLRREGPGGEFLRNKGT